MGERERRLYPNYVYKWESERHGLSVLNADEPTDVASRFNEARETGQINFEELTEPHVVGSRELRGFTISPSHRVIHMLDESELGEFHGMYIGEEKHGDLHPILLLPVHEVIKYSDR